MHLFRIKLYRVLTVTALNWSENVNTSPILPAKYAVPSYPRIRFAALNAVPEVVMHTKCQFVSDIVDDTAPST